MQQLLALYLSYIMNIRSQPTTAYVSYIQVQQMCQYHDEAEVQEKSCFIADLLGKDLETRLTIW